MRKLLIAMAGTATLLAGCSTMEGDVAGAPPGDMTPETRAQYVMMAGASDLFEIQSGQLAQQKGQRAEVRQFGQMMVAHHTQTTQQVTAAARASGMNPPPPTLLPMQRDMMAQLERASANEFDALYLRQQAQAHQMALNLHQNYARNGDTPALRTVAGNAVPIVTQHIERLRQLN